ncbi:MAG: serine hydrolase, partial [Clostridium sp.]|nr:serine hydrolase [Clostridium sp.]
VMTALIAIEEGELSDTVQVTKDAVITESGASLCGIKPGDTLTMEQLLYGLLIPSGNDAANAIAVHMSGSVEAFAERMNEKARQLGATQTHFKNPSGLSDPEHYTTAYDLYLIFNEAMKLPKFREIIGADAYTASYTDAQGNAVSKTWKVGNWYQNGETETPEGLTVLGGKTGTTQAAGYCLIMAEQDEAGKEYISIVLKAENRQGLYKNMTNIITKIVD